MLKLHLDDADYTTIGGLLFGQLGRLPKVGDRVNLQGATFEILEMDGRRVGRVRVWAAATPAPGPSSQSPRHRPPGASRTASPRGARIQPASPRPLRSGKRRGGEE